MWKRKAEIVIKAPNDTNISAGQNAQSDSEDQGDGDDEEEEEEEDTLPKLSIRTANLDEYPSSKKEILDVFTLSRTNQILQGHSPTTMESLAPKQDIINLKKLIAKAKGKKHKAKKAFSVNAKVSGLKKVLAKLSGATKPTPTPAPRKTGFSPQKRKWMELVASEIFSAKVNVEPKPMEVNANVMSQDPRRGRYMRVQDFSSPADKLCKLIRLHLISDIIQKHDLIRPKINTNLGKGKPSKKDLDEWKLRRGRQENEKNRKKRKKVISIKKIRFMSRYRPCKTCGDFHFKKTCSGYDLKINVMVKQIYQKAEVIKETMTEAWDKLENLENTYHDMLMKVHRLQSNRVCLGLLTGENYPGESHPTRCPCVDQKAKEELDKKKQEERLREEEKKEVEEQLKRERERKRREMMIQLRKRRFYTKLMQREPGQEGRVRFQTIAKPILDDEENESDLSSEDEDRENDKTEDDVKSSFDLLMEEDSPAPDMSFTQPTSFTSLTRLEAATRRRRSLLIDDIEMTGLKPRKSLLTRLMEKVEGRPMELVVMDGSIKSLEPKYEEEGGMIKADLSIESLSFEESLEGSSDKKADSLETLSEESETIESPQQEEQHAESLPKEEFEQKEEKVPFSEFLDLMEVF